MNEKPKFRLEDAVEEEGKAEIIRTAACSGKTDYLGDRTFCQKNEPNQKPASKPSDRCKNYDECNCEYHRICEINDEDERLERAFRDWCGKH